MLALCVVVIIVVMKLPPRDLSSMVDKVLELIEKRVLWSYVLNFVLIMSYFFHVRHLRRNFSQEYKRIGEEKSALQNKLAGRKFKSSDT